MQFLTNEELEEHLKNKLPITTSDYTSVNQVEKIVCSLDKKVVY